MSKNHELLARDTKKRTTMQDIADLLDVSKNSIYLALNDKPGVGSELRRRILDEAERLGYGGYAAQSQEAKNKCIMVIVPEYLRGDAFFYSDIFWAIETEAKKRGTIPLTNTVTREAEKSLTMPSLPEAMAVVGFLVIGVLDKEYVKRLYELGLPTLSVDIPYYELPIGCVGSANHAGGFLAANHLIGKGHKKIGFVGPIHAAQSVYERWCGFYQAMDMAGIQVEEKYNIIGQPGHFELFDTVEVLSSFFERMSEYPSAWFCGGDRIAISMINLLTMHGKRVPEDISIMGFDDIPVAKMVFPQLTTMHVRRRRMGRLAVEHLLRIGEQAQELLHICLPCALVERGSVAALTP